MRRGALAGWLAGLALALAASWAIWRLSDIYDADLRLAACLVPLVVWGLLPVLFWRFFTGAGRQPAAPNLREQKKAALALLAEAGLSGRRTRYSVPFYLVVGAPGVGKSSLLDRSGIGLRTPASIGDATWWAGEDAVFVEVSTGVPDQSPIQACELVRSLRPLQPINGILHVVSPADLVLADQAEHRELARLGAQGLREIADAIDQPAPVYLVLSKIDLLPGFQEFFDRQEPQERAQPWGFALPFAGLSAPPSASDAADAIAGGFRSLLAAMRLRLVEWLSREADPVRCARINAFGAQVAALQGAIQPVLDAMLPGPSRAAWQGAALRGVYLTSARQEALSIDALLPELSRRFAMPRTGMIPPDLALDDEDHGYFIGGALRKMVFPEAGLVGLEDGRRAGRIAQWAVIAAIVAASLAAGYYVFQIFDDEVRVAARAAEAADEIRPIAGPVTTDALPTILASIRRLDALGSDIDGAGNGGLKAAGLSAGPRLDRAIDDARARLRRNALAPTLVVLLQAGLVDLDAGAAPLRERIALAEAAGAPDAAALHRWLESQAAALADDDRSFFIDEAVALFTTDGGLAVDPSYVDAARRIIAYKESLS